MSGHFCVLLLLCCFFLCITSEPTISIKTTKHKYETNLVQQLQTQEDCPIAVVYNFETKTETILQPTIQVTSREEPAYNSLLSGDVIFMKMDFAYSSSIDSKQFINSMITLLNEQPDCLKVSQFENNEITSRANVLFWLINCVSATPEQQLAVLNSFSEEQFKGVGFENVKLRNINEKIYIPEDTTQDNQIDEIIVMENSATNPFWSLSMLAFVLCLF